MSPRRLAAAACLAVVPPVGWWAVLNAPLDAGLVPVPLIVLPAAAGLFAVLAWRDGDTGRFGACGLVATAAAATRWASFYVAFAPRWVSIGLASAASIGWLWLCWRHATGRTRM